jgi:hypothetical protein
LKVNGRLQGLSTVSCYRDMPLDTQH